MEELGAAQLSRRRRAVTREWNKNAKIGLTGLSGLLGLVVLEEACDQVCLVTGNRERLFLQELLELRHLQRVVVGHCVGGALMRCDAARRWRWDDSLSVA